ncbi:cytochrome C assembly family protein [Derxia gummosa]|uniref:Cytochrome C assembly family protein n=1 Tax=Derxia gummosa DSM 723 TaxID=1121388 RepID=A0A8B6XA57_9BURK|nr:cytochrome c biogenesis protein CcsA [Derxia gummosa]
MLTAETSVIALLYLLLTWLLWRFVERAQPPGGAAMTLAPPPEVAVGPGLRLAEIAVVIGHCYVLFGVMLADHQLAFNFAAAISFMVLVGCAAQLVNQLFLPVNLFGVVLFPLGFVASALVLLFPPPVLKLEATYTPLLGTHFLLAMLAYGVLCVSAIYACGIFALDRLLHARPASPWQRHPVIGPLLRLAPPLLLLERVLFGTILVGFGLLTASIATGVGFHEQMFGRPFRLDHKFVFSVLSWLVFAVLLLGRWRFGWRGRVAMRQVFVGFGLLFLGYIGSNFVVEVLLHRG